MAENTKILTAEQESQLRAPIDEYVGAIQEKINALRADGTDKVIDLHNSIDGLKRDKIYTQEEKAAKLAQYQKELEQAKEKAADLKNSAVAVQKEYDKIMSWADLYAGSSIEGKKMILRQLIERVNIGRNFEIEVEFKISVTQFFDFLHPEGDKSVYYRAS